MVTLVNGVQHWTVPYTGTYQISAVGAAGGYDDGGPTARGRGAYMRGEFELRQEDVIQILVGQHGNVNNVSYSAGGGGGTFVVTSSDVPLIIAGGGGGIQYLTSRLSNCDASTGTSGNANECSSICSIWSGGTNGGGGNGSVSQNSGGGGGGFLSNGQMGTEFNGGKSFLNGGLGGNSTTHNVVGGFGGGGGAHGQSGGGGGGGGYSGGASGVKSTINSCGGGGGSFNNGKNQKNITAYNKNGHGYVEIIRVFV